MILLGAAIAVAAALLRLPSLAFAVGVYLPISTMAAVFLGGLLRFVLVRKTGGAEAARRRERGVLFGSGLVGGEGLMGVAIAIWVLASGDKLGAGPLAALPPAVPAATAVAGIAGILGVIAFFATRGRT